MLTTPRANLMIYITLNITAVAHEHFFSLSLYRYFTGEILNVKHKKVKTFSCHFGRKRGPPAILADRVPS